MVRLKLRRLQPFPISEFSGRQAGLVSKDTGDGEGGPISFSMWQPQLPLRPPLGLLPVPHRVRVKGVSSAHHEEVGGLPAASHDNQRSPPDPRYVTLGLAAGRRNVSDNME